MTAITAVTSVSLVFRSALFLALLLGILICSAPQAGAVSSAVKYACMADYFAYCSAYDVGSTALRQCMRNAGSKLSKRCISALVTAGEVSKSEVRRRAAQAN
jgi:hypothetical protein